ncbi:MAG: ABC transporter substrate-binding protein [Gammaproteobacteria bacterium]|nr:ABC transporter substrate-binding protein [Gammaproteobacteria bacterium]
MTTPSTLLCLLLVLALPGQAVAETTSPSRVVSINLCTDQLLLMLANPEQIASLSHLARDPQSSFIAEQATAYPANHARLEELLHLQPDLVLAGAFSDPRLLRQLKRLGIRVEAFPLTHSIAGIKRDIRRMAELLNRTESGARLIDELETRLARLQSKTTTSRLKALFYQPRGYTSGVHTLQDTALQAAGWRNLATELGIQGYAPLDLETLLQAEPDRLFTSSHTPQAGSRAQQQLQHPALQRLLRDRPIQEIPFKYWICAGPMITDAIQMLRAVYDH